MPFLNEWARFAGVKPGGDMGTGWCLLWGCPSTGDLRELRAPLRRCWSSWGMWMLPCGVVHPAHGATVWDAP